MQVSVHWEITNARDLGDGDIGPKTVHLLTMQEIVEDVDERCVVVEADEEEDDEEDVPVLRCQPMPRWYSRNQQGLCLRCNRHKSLL